MLQDSDGQRYLGVVKKNFPATHGRPAHGFIECAEIAAAFGGRDVFMHDKLAVCVQIGQTLSFSVRMNDAGMPQAVDVRTEDGAAVEHTAGPIASAVETHYAAPVPTAQRMCDLLLPEAAPALAKGLHQAVAVSLWNTAELLGIAENLRQQVLTTMPRDHHPHSSKGGWMQHRPGPYEYGHVVDYGYKGGGHWESKGYGKKGGADYSGGLNGDLGYGGGSHQATGPFEGVVKTIKRAEEGHAHTHGFVDCAETNQIYGRDVFLHSQQAQDLQVGNRVRFEVMVNQKGMPQAHNLVLYG